MDDTQATVRVRRGRAAPADPAKLRHARFAAGLKPAEAATAASIGRQHLSAIENGKGGVSIDVLRRLADAYSTDIASLLKED